MRVANLMSFSCTSLRLDLKRGVLVLSRDSCVPEDGCRAIAVREHRLAGRCREAQVGEKLLEEVPRLVIGGLEVEDAGCDAGAGEAGGPVIQSS